MENAVFEGVADTLYIPLAACSRYQRYFPTLPAEIQRDVYARMAEILAEEKAYCDEGNWDHIAQILGRRGLMKLGAMCCHADIINGRRDTLWRIRRNSERLRGTWRSGSRVPARSRRPLHKVSIP